MDLNTFNVTNEVETWKSSVLSIERNKEQSVKVNEHTNDVYDVDYTYHSNNGKHSNYVPHSDYSYHSNAQGHNQYSPHSNSPSYHSNDHTNYTQAHANYTGAHVNGYSQTAHQNYPGEHKNSGVKPNHNDYNGHYNAGHRDGHQNSGHANANGYHNQSGYTQVVKHSNAESYHYNNHSDTDPHVDNDSYHSNSHYNNYNAHSNYSTHNNSGFDHINYIPSTPNIYDSKGYDEFILNGTQDIYFYSYDKNNDGVGSQFDYSKKVLYQVEIRKVKDLNKNPSTTSWKILQSFSEAESYRINTIDPLKVGNTNASLTEGYYEIRITPKNTEYSGVTFVGTPLVKEVKIQQNSLANITVKNKEEFLNFTFGIEGAVDTKSNFIDYSNLIYNQSTKKDFKGLFINIGVLDNDIEDYLKGFVNIKSGDSLIATAPIIWGNGENIIKSNNQEQEGYIYISKNDLLTKFDETSFENAAIEIHLKDYKDSIGTIEKGGYVISRKTDLSTGEDLFVNIDKVAPKISSVSGNDKLGQSTTISLSATDDISGIKSITLPNGNIINSPNISFSVSMNGLYSFILTDKVGNIRIVNVEVTNLDTNKPTVNITNNTNWTNQNVQVSVSATDN